MWSIFLECFFSLPSALSPGVPSWHLGHLALHTFNDSACSRNLGPPERITQTPKMKEEGILYFTGGAVADKSLK